MKWHPDLINKAKKDGFTPLHMAVVNGHTDIVSVLLSHVSLHFFWRHTHICTNQN